MGGRWRPRLVGAGKKPHAECGALKTGKGSRNSWPRTFHGQLPEFTLLMPAVCNVGSGTCYIEFSFGFDQGRAGWP
jgi:hypothetical protein